MSLERAYINCEKCYSAGNDINIERHNVRNEAMKALEEYNCEPITQKREKFARRALMICRKCDFKSAGIVGLIESIEKETADSIKRAKKMK